MGFDDLKKIATVWIAGAALCVVVAIVMAVNTTPAKPQTMHPDAVWLYRLIDALDARVKKLEEAQR